MVRAGFHSGERALALAACFVSVAALTSCGGGSTGNSRDSGVNKTYLSVEASDRLVARMYTARRPLAKA